jgi:uncharacterized protein YqfA (UPF0365 family)
MLSETGKTMLPPALTVTFILSLAVPLILGFLVGIVIKNALAIGVAVAFIILILIAVGIVSPHEVITPIVSAFKSGGALTSKVMEVAGYLPYSSIFFIIGAIVGYFKG